MRTQKTPHRQTRLKRIVALVVAVLLIAIAVSIVAILSSNAGHHALHGTVRGLDGLRQTLKAGHD